MSRFTVHSDGSGSGTVVLTEDGEKLKGISGLAIHIDAHGLAELTLEAAPVEVNVVADKTETTFYCSLCQTIDNHTCPPMGGQAPGGLMVFKPCRAVFSNMTIQNANAAIFYCSLNGNTYHKHHFDADKNKSWVA